MAFCTLVPGIARPKNRARIETFARSCEYVARMTHRPA